MTLYGFYPKRYKYPFGFLGAKQKKPKQSFRQCRPSGSGPNWNTSGLPQLF